MADHARRAYLEMAKVIPRKTLPPNATNVLAVKNAAGSDKVAGELRGKPNGNAGKGKDVRTGYGTRPGNCSKCKEPGHYSYKYKSQESPAATSAAITTLYNSTPAHTPTLTLTSTRRHRSSMFG